MPVCHLPEEQVVNVAAVMQDLHHDFGQFDSRGTLERKYKLNNKHNVTKPLLHLLEEHLVLLVHGGDDLRRVLHDVLWAVCQGTLESNYIFGYQQQCHYVNTSLP